MNKIEEGIIHQKNNEWFIKFNNKEIWPETKLSLYYLKYFVINRIIINLFQLINYI